MHIAEAPSRQRWLTFSANNFDSPSNVVVYRLQATNANRNFTDILCRYYYGTSTHNGSSSSAMAGIQMAAEEEEQQNTSEHTKPNGLHRCCPMSTTTRFSSSIVAETSNLTLENKNERFFLSLSSIAIH